MTKSKTAAEIGRMRVSAATAAALLGVSGVTFARLAEVGAFERAEKRDGYALGTVIRGVVAHYLKLASGNVGDLDEARELALSRARLASAAAAERELRVQQMRGEVVSIAAAEKGWAGLVASFRETALTIPDKIASACEMRGREEIEQIIVGEIHELLETLSSVEAAS